MSITVVVPVLNHLFLTDNLLSYISSNLVKPVEIILVDNNSFEDIVSLVPKYKELNIVYLKQNNNIGVNAAWNLGISLAKGSLISILNNDIIISKYFFKYI
jgi:GT2 family glycosyltransferase